MIQSPSKNPKEKVSMPTSSNLLITQSVRILILLVMLSCLISLYLRQTQSSCYFPPEKTATFSSCLFNKR